MKAKNTTTIENFFDKKELKGKTLAYNTKKQYNSILHNYSEQQGTPLKDLLKEAKEEQTPYLNSRNQIIMPDIEDSMLSARITSYIKSQKEAKLQPQSINDKITKIKSFYTFHNIDFPKFKLQTEKNKVQIMEKKELENILKNMSLKKRAIYTFLLSTGIRISDVAKFTVEDFMESLGMETLDELINTKEINTVGYWEFVPQKTKNSSGVTCMTCSTPEANNNILMLLKRRKMEWKLTLDQPLFMTNRLKPYTANILSVMSRREANKIQKLREEEYRKQYRGKEISEKKYHDLMENTPKFHAHGLRKYFISVLANHSVPSRISAVMEGHVPPIATDDHYVKISKEAVIDEYLKIVPYLSFERVEVRMVDNKKYNEMEDRLNHLEMLLSQRS